MHTKVQQEKILSEIDILLDSIYTKDGLDKALSEKIRHSTAELVKETIKEDPATKLEEIKEELLNTPVIEVVLAYEPDEAFIEKMYEILAAKTGQAAILDIKQDKTIIGGAQIIKDGYYHDYTLKKLLEAKL